VTSFTHVGVATGTCQTCHGGAYPGVMTKPAGTGHIPTTVAGLPGNECSYCHSSKTSFAVERMNHGSIQTLCVTCHDRTSPYPGSMEKINRASHHSAGSKDCSSSGCHRPLGSKGTPYSKWN
jgi:predicted CXXCH cytochrome family protein